MKKITESEFLFLSNLNKSIDESLAQYLNTKFETDRIVWSAQLDKNVKPNPDYCGQADGELYLSDPRKLQNNMY